MPHPRQLIREAAKAALVGRTAAGERVYETRVTPFRRLDLPAIAIYTTEEEVAEESRSTAPRELDRSVSLEIVAAVKPGTNVDDAIDDFTQEIERAMHADPTLGGTASDSILSGTAINVLEEGDQIIGVATLTYSVRYFTQAPDAADVVLDDFETADIRTNLGGAVEAANQAHDVVDLTEPEVP